MTAYFDEAYRQVSDAPREPEAFLARLIATEDRVRDDVLKNLDHPDFPVDLRNLLLVTIAVHATRRADGTIQENVKRMNLTLRSSELIEELHSSYHELARRRVKARFTVWWSDDPAGNNRLSKAWEGDPENKVK